MIHVDKYLRAHPEQTDQAATDGINALHYRDIPVAELKRRAFVTGVIKQARTIASDNNQPVVIQDAAADFLEYLNLGTDILQATDDVSRAAYLGIISALESGGVDSTIADQFRGLIFGEGYSPLTTADVQSLRSDLSLTLAAETLQLDYEDALGAHVNPHGATREELAFGLEAAAVQLRAGGGI